MVFAVGDVADAVEPVFDAPVAADPSGQVGGASLPGGQASDGVKREAQWRELTKSRVESSEAPPDTRPIFIFYHAFPEDP